MLGGEKVGRMLGSLSKAVMAAGVFEEIMALRGGSDDLASLVSRWRTW